VWLTASVEWLLCPLLDSVNSLFAFLFQKPGKPQKSAIYGA
jgi:hypothetical protein